MKKLILISCAVFFMQHSRAGDTTRVFSLENFLQVVKQFHPLAKKASLQVDKAEASLLSARGGFDPVLGTSKAEKTFDGLNYYNDQTTQLSIPTWYGIELSAGTESLSGNRTDPQETSGRTSFAGITVPLAKNLLMDKRRAALKQAGIYIRMSEQEKRSAINDLYKDAIGAYWNWAQRSWVYQLYSDVTELNRKRVQLVRTAYINGERPAIDTTEAIAQMLSFEYQQNQALLDLQNAKLVLETFLWAANDQQYQLPEGTEPATRPGSLPDMGTMPVLQNLLDEALARHPDLASYPLKLNALDIEKRLKFQELLPKADLKYNQLGKGYDLSKTITSPWFNNNYRWGFSVSIPLRLSQGRGEYRLAKLKIRETRIDRQVKETELITKIKTMYNQVLNYQSQVNLLQRTYEQNLRLQRAEETRFFNGESSLFLVNSRETKALESRVKLLETVAGYQKTVYSLRWAAGLLWNEF